MSRKSEGKSVLFSRAKSDDERFTLNSLTLFIKIGATTATTFLLAFFPFLRPFPRAPLTLLERIFPLQRGIFEDKVANFWCASNVVLKWKNWFEAASMAKASHRSEVSRARHSESSQLTRG